MAIEAQTPVDSPFDRKSTAKEVVAGQDLSGKTMIVTGGYSGVGLETTRALAEAGATVIVPVRNPEKAVETLKDIDGEVITLPMDLADLASIRAFADQVLADYPKIDILINNAGIMATPETRVGPGWESQFGVNHMGHFALTQALMPALEAADAPRVIAVSSMAHKMSDIRWDDPHFDNEDYDKWQAYGQAKTANALFANALARRLAPMGGTAYSLVPGGILTPLQRHLSKEEMMAMGWIDENGEIPEAFRDFWKSPEQGASTTVWVATTDLLDEKSGVYCENCNVAEPTDPESPMARALGVEAHAVDDASAERLWEMSEKLLGEA